ncbi:MAG: hypothetical protein ABFD98_12135 [Syntrophobacteraceae bacterium]|nr:hypothetical protein [Desulfobacteraceae bacterium]
MSRKSLLGCLEKRDLLNRAAVAVETLISEGKEFEEAGQLSDAIDFYEKARDHESLTRILEIAREEADVFLLGRIGRILNAPLQADEWLAVAERAEKLGKQAFAAEAYRRGGREAPTPPEGDAA